jgi:hypothetical protein
MNAYSGTWFGRNYVLDLSVGSISWFLLKMMSSGIGNKNSCIYMHRSVIAVPKAYNLTCATCNIFFSVYIRDIVIQLQAVRGTLVSVQLLLVIVQRYISKQPVFYRLASALIHCNVYT